MERSISPPAKRRRLSTSQPAPERVTADHLTVYSWNVNGIQPLLQRPITSFFGPRQSENEDYIPFNSSLRDFLKRHGWPTMLFLQEVKISPDDGASIRALEKAVRAGPGAGDQPDYVAHMCLPSDRFNARGFGRKVYGVCSIIRKDFADRHVERIRPVSWDLEGRFLVIETKSAGDAPPLAIINAYMVNGTENPYKDPSTGEVSGTRHDRKIQVHKLLAAECRALQADSFGVVLAGDLNIARAPIDGHPNLRTFPRQHCVNRADFENHFFGKQVEAAPEPDREHDNHREHGQGLSKDDEGNIDAGLGAMIDTFRHLHPAERAYTYYPRGKAFGESCDRVDMILISATLQGNLTESGMHETPRERGSSDHVPLYCCLDFQKTGRSKRG